MKNSRGGLDLKDKFLYTENRNNSLGWENAFATGRELAFLTSTVMKSKYRDYEAAESFGMRDVVFYVFSSAILLLITEKCKRN